MSHLIFESSSRHRSSTASSKLPKKLNASVLQQSKTIERTRSYFYGNKSCWLNACLAENEMSSLRGETFFSHCLNKSKSLFSVITTVWYLEDISKKKQMKTLRQTSIRRWSWSFAIPSIQYSRPIEQEKAHRTRPVFLRGPGPFKGTSRNWISFMSL